MKLSYGWVIVGAGAVITCIGLGTGLSLGVFLQPMSAATGWSCTGISMAAMLVFLCMGAASFAWGALSDRFGTRAVVLSGGVLLGAGLMAASQATSLGQFQLVFGIAVGVAAGSFYAPMTATVTRWFTQHRSLAVALVSAGIGLGSATVAPFARWVITGYDWRIAMMAIGAAAWLFIIPLSLLIRRPPAVSQAARPMATSGDGGRDFTLAQALRTPQFAAISLTHYIGSFGIGLGAVAIAVTFSPPSTEAGVLRPVAA